MNSTSTANTTVRRCGNARATQNEVWVTRGMPSRAELSQRSRGAAHVVSGRIPRDDRQRYMGVRNHMAEEHVDFVVLAPLEIERQALLKHVDSFEERSRDGTTRAIVRFMGGEYRLVVPAPMGMGNAAAAAGATRAIDVWSPRYVALVGIAGGVKAQGRRLGDVVVAEQIVGYELGAQREKGTERRYEVHRPAHDFVQAARMVPLNSWFPSEDRPLKSAPRPKVHFGVVASGEKVIRSKKFVNSLSSSWSKLAAVEMEGFGTALAAFRAPTLPGMVMVRGIADWADPEKDDRWQAYAADCAASFFIAVLRLGRLQSQAARPAQPAQRIAPYNGRNKIDLCGRLGDSWEDLADYFDIPLGERARFTKGRECQRIWEWLELRRKLGGLPDALKRILREDLLDTLVLQP